MHVCIYTHILIYVYRGERYKHLLGHTSENNPFLACFQCCWRPASNVGMRPCTTWECWKIKLPWKVLIALLSGIVSTKSLQLDRWDTSWHKVEWEAGVLVWSRGSYPDQWATEEKSLFGEFWAPLLLQRKIHVKTRGTGEKEDQFVHYLSICRICGPKAWMLRKRNWGIWSMKRWQQRQQPLR